MGKTYRSRYRKSFSDLSLKKKYDEAFPQTCLTPDYILVTKDKRNELLGHLKEAYDQFYPDGGLNSQSYSSIINEQHFTRLTDLMKRSKGKVEFGGRTDKKNLKMEIAVVTDVDENDSLMEE